MCSSEMLTFPDSLAGRNMHRLSGEVFAFQGIGSASCRGSASYYYSIFLWERNSCLTTKLTSMNQKTSRTLSWTHSFLLSYFYQRFVFRVFRRPVPGFANFVHCFCFHFFISSIASFLLLSLGLLCCFPPLSYTLASVVLSISCFPINVKNVNFPYVLLWYKLWPCSTVSNVSWFSLQFLC